MQSEISPEAMQSSLQGRIGGSARRKETVYKKVFDEHRVRLKCEKKQTAVLKEKEKIKTGLKIKAG